MPNESNFHGQKTRNIGERLSQSGMDAVRVGITALLQSLREPRQRLQPPRHLLHPAERIREPLQLRLCRLVACPDEVWALHVPVSFRQRVSAELTAADGRPI